MFLLLERICSDGSILHDSKAVNVHVLIQLTMTVLHSFTIAF